MEDDKINVELAIQRYTDLHNVVLNAGKQEYLVNNILHFLKSMNENVLCPTCNQTRTNKNKVLTSIMPMVLAIYAKSPNEDLDQKIISQVVRLYLFFNNEVYRSSSTRCAFFNLLHQGTRPTLLMRNSDPNVSKAFLMDYLYDMNQCNEKKTPDLLRQMMEVITDMWPLIVAL